jgi:hypothetical protein
MDARDASVVPGARLKVCRRGCQRCVAGNDSAVLLGVSDCIAEQHRGPRAQFSILRLVSFGLYFLTYKLPCAARTRAPASMKTAVCFYYRDFPDGVSR